MRVAFNEQSIDFRQLASSLAGSCYFIMKSVAFLLKHGDSAHRCPQTRLLETQTQAPWTGRHVLSVTVSPSVPRSLTHHTGRKKLQPQCPGFPATSRLSSSASSAPFTPGQSPGCCGGLQKRLRICQPLPSPPQARAESTSLSCTKKYIYTSIHTIR